MTKDTQDIQAAVKRAHADVDVLLDAIPRHAYDDYGSRAWALKAEIDNLADLVTPPAPSQDREKALKECHDVFIENAVAFEELIKIFGNIDNSSDLVLVMKEQFKKSKAAAYSLHQFALQSPSHRDDAESLNEEDLVGIAAKNCPHIDWAWADFGQITKYREQATWVIRALVSAGLLRIAAPAKQKGNK